MDFPVKSTKTIYEACHFQCIGNKPLLIALNIIYISKCFLSFSCGLPPLFYFPTKLLPVVKTRHQVLPCFLILI